MNLKLTHGVTSVTLEAADGQPKQYELREMSSAAREAYLDRLRGRMSSGGPGEGEINLKKMEGLRADLLSHTLFDLEAQKYVEATVIQTWPDGPVGELFAEAQKLNHLDSTTAPTEKKS